MQRKRLCEDFNNNKVATVAENNDYSCSTKWKRLNLSATKMIGRHKETFLSQLSNTYLNVLEQEKDFNTLLTKDTKQNA